MKPNKHSAYSCVKKPRESTQARSLRKRHTYRHKAKLLTRSSSSSTSVLSSSSFSHRRTPTSPVNSFEGTFNAIVIPEIPHEEQSSSPHIPDEFDIAGSFNRGMFPEVDEILPLVTCPQCQLTNLEISNPHTIFCPRCDLRVSHPHGRPNAMSILTALEEVTRNALASHGCVAHVRSELRQMEPGILVILSCPLCHEEIVSKVPWDPDTPE
eukprot:gnl/Dysnectes_brevis/5095_a7179_790.p1 GENE.gnl/Dysnectes_brevis/5095_a7179_790~~gnl/Dysnectes_brevis/5095_a7179_790.p1  ORF type:complete len:229 (+),score=16.34 gnl/Dysnectes_brevis/5095_a7179_790:56-688(+)